MNLVKTVPVFPEKLKIILFLKKQALPAEVIVHADTDLSVRNLKYAFHVPLKDLLPFAETAKSAITYVLILNLRLVKNFFLLLTSATVVQNATLPVL